MGAEELVGMEVWRAGEDVKGAPRGVRIILTKLRGCYWGSYRTILKPRVWVGDNSE